MTPAARRFAVAVATLGALAGRDAVRPAAPSPRVAPVPAARGGARDSVGSDATIVPFRVGERLDYDVKFGPVPVGTGSMQVDPMDTVRGVRAWHTVFTVKGGTFFYQVNDRLESWFDPRGLMALRFRETLHEGGHTRDHAFEIFPERARFSEDGGAAQPSVAAPLDDGSFLYFVRTIPLEVGHEYVFNRYFRPDRNPVRLIVLRRERVTVPAGTFNAIVVRPIIKTGGIFSESGQAELWLSDDSSRMMLQMKSKLSFGSLDLYLRAIRSLTP